MKADAAAGKLDFIDRNVEKARRDGTLIPLERIFLIAPKLTADGIKDKGKPSRVDFALR